MRHRLATSVCFGYALLAACDDWPTEADGRSCTAAGCSSGVRVTIDGSNHDWANGGYTLDLRLGGREHRCTFSLPVEEPAQAQAPTTAFDCEPALPEARFAPEIALYSATNCPAAADSGAEASGATVPGCHYSIMITSEDTPADTEVRLALAERVLAEGTRRFEYVEIAPNGKECGPICSNAEVELLVAE